MRTKFKEYVNLIEDYSKAETIGNIRENLKKCIETKTFLFRGSNVESHGVIGHRNPRDNRTSATGSNLILNYCENFIQEFPSRKRSYFATNSYNQANNFGHPFIIIPHDNVQSFGIVQDDFNLKNIGELDSVGIFPPDISSFLTMFFGFSKILSVLYDEWPRDAVINIIGKEASKRDFEELNFAFKKVGPQFLNEFTEEKIKKMHGVEYRSLSKFLKALGNLHDFDFLEFLKRVMSKEGLGVEVTNSLNDVIQYISCQSEFSPQEIWFEGKMSYFSVSMIKRDVFRRTANDEVYSYEHTDPDKFNEMIADFFRERFKI